MIKTESCNTDYFTFIRESSIVSSLFFPIAKQGVMNTILKGTEAVKRKGHRIVVLHTTMPWWAGLLCSVTGQYLSVKFSFITKFVFSLFLEGKCFCTKAIISVAQSAVYWKCWQMSVFLTLKSQSLLFWDFFHFCHKLWSFIFWFQSAINYLPVLTECAFIFFSMQRLW